MSIRRALAIAGKEFRHIVRDLRTFFLVTVSPAFLLVTLSYIFALDVQRVDLAVWDQDASYLSRRYVAVLTSDGDFRARSRASSYPEMDRLLRSGRVDIGLVIPPSFEEAFQGGQQPQIEAVVDGADPISANQAVYSLIQRTTEFASEHQTPPPRVAGFELRSDVWYNEELESLVSMVPGLVAIVLCMPALALALALTREKETGSFETLITTPVRGAEYLAGKLAAYVVSGLASAVLVWLVAVLYFGIPFRSDFSLYLLLAADYLIASMGFSLFIANFVENQQTAMFLVLMIFFVPSFFIAGLISPVNTSVLLSRLAACSLPTTHFIDISRGLFLKGSSAIVLGFRPLLLAGMGLGGLLLSLLLFQKRLG